MSLEEKLLAQMADVAVVIDANGLYSYVSPSVAAYGFDPAELIGRTNMEFTHPDDRAKVQRLMRDLLAGRLDESADREYRVLLPDGRHLWVEGQPSLLFDDDGEAVGYLTILRDITGRHRNRVNAADDAIRRLFNHEIRTPLNGILAASEMLARAELPQKLRTLVEDVATSALFLRRTLASFLGEPPAAEDISSSVTEIADAARRLRVLAADDHPINLHMVEAILDPVADVVMVDNGKAALDAFNSGEFDVVLLDVQMPIMDGLETVRAIRDLPTRRRATPVIMVTANAAPEDELASLQAGANLHLTKPILPHQLLQAVLAHVEF